MIRFSIVVTANSFNPVNNQVVLAFSDELDAYLKITDYGEKVSWFINN